MFHRHFQKWGVEQSTFGGKYWGCCEYWQDARRMKYRHIQVISVHRFDHFIHIKDAYLYVLNKSTNNKSPPYHALQDQLSRSNEGSVGV